MPPPEKDLQDQLRKLGIKPFKDDPRQLTRDEVLSMFSAHSSGRLILRKLVRSVIWHVHQGIQLGDIDLIESNIRGFWYLWLKPILSHLDPGDLSKKADPYKALTQELTNLVMRQKLITYSDFDFTDENFEHRRIGVQRPEVLVFAEKRGWIRLLRRLHKNLSCSTLALGGSPSSLTSEYTSRDIKKSIAIQSALPPDQEPHQLSIHLVGIVDYDPSGHTIASAFAAHLQATGLAVASMVTLIKPNLYSPEQLKIFEFPLPTHHRSRNQKWLLQTGGIAGRLFGLEAESLPTRQAQKLLETIVLNLPKIDQLLS